MACSHNNNAETPAVEPTRFVFPLCTGELRIEFPSDVSVDSLGLVSDFLKMAQKQVQQRIKLLQPAAAETPVTVTPDQK